MGKLKVGSVVRIKKETIKWYLSDEGQDCFFPASGKLNSFQEESHSSATIAMLTLAMDSSIAGKVVAVNHPNTQIENYRVSILGTEFNMSKQYLMKVKSDG